LCCVYFVWEIYGTPRVRQFAQVCLFAIICFMASVNTLEGKDAGRSIRQKMEAFERDLRAGVPISALAQRHVFLYPASSEELAKYLRLLHRAQIGQFKHLQDDAS
jgi:hypothetical protein